MSEVVVRDDGLLKSHYVPLMNSDVVVSDAVLVSHFVPLVNV